ncbi:hypothetical protein BHE74_00021224 [Ensete ventricosum]|nr:hypothetical protein BHE74_00021224 [Ensete ventricosum]
MTHHHAIILFSKGCPSHLAPFGRHRRCRCPCAGGDGLYGRRPSAGWHCPYSLAAGKEPLAGWPLVASGASARRRPSCGHRARSQSPACRLLPLRVVATCGLLPMRAAAPLQGGLGCSRLALAAGLAVGGRPYKGVGHGWPPLLLTTFTAKMQQERVERFYAI